MPEYPREIPPMAGQSVEGTDIDERETPSEEAAAEVLRLMEEAKPVATINREGDRGIINEESHQQEVGAAVFAGGGEKIFKKLGESDETRLGQSRH